MTLQGQIFPGPQEVQHEVTPVEMGSGGDVAVEVHHLEQLPPWGCCQRGGCTWGICAVCSLFCAWSCSEKKRNVTTLSLCPGAHQAGVTELAVEGGLPLRDTDSCGILEWRPTRTDASLNLRRPLCSDCSPPVPSTAILPGTWAQRPSPSSACRRGGSSGLRAGGTQGLIRAPHRAAVRTF